MPVENSGSDFGRVEGATNEADDPEKSVRGGPLPETSEHEEKPNGSKRSIDSEEKEKVS